MDIVSSLRQQDKASDSTRGENEFTAIRNVFNEMYALRHFKEDPPLLGNQRGNPANTLPQSRLMAI